MGRNHPGAAARAAALGRHRDDLIRALTVDPAAVSDGPGHIDREGVGKDAAVVFTNGDPLAVIAVARTVPIGGGTTDLDANSVEQRARETERPPHTAAPVGF